MEIKSSLHYFKNCIEKPLKYLFYELSIPQVKARKGDLKKLLIIRIDNIGDYVIFSDVLSCYRDLYPKDKWHITLLGNNVWTSLAERCPYFDSVMSLDKYRFSQALFYRRSIIKHIRNESFDVVIYPTYSREPLGDWLIRLSGAKERIGYDGDYSNIEPEQKTKSDKYYTQLISSQAHAILETERNRHFVRELNSKLGSKFKETVYSAICLRPEDEEASQHLLRENDINDDPFIIFFPGASSSDRIWPVEHYAKIAYLLKQEHNIHIVVCGGPGEEFLFKRIQSNTNIPLINLVGKTSLPVLATIIKRSQLYLGTETSGVHIAAAVGTPTVCIMGGGYFGRFFPYGDLEMNKVVYHQMDCYGCKWHCIYDDGARCIKLVDVGSVYEEVRHHLTRIS